MNVCGTRIYYLENIDTLPRDMAKKLILFVEMAAEHLG